MLPFVRFFSNFTSKNKQIALISKARSNELACFTNKTNKRSSKIMNDKHSFSPDEVSCAFNRCCIVCRHHKVQKNTSVCGLFGVVNMSNNTVTFEKVEICRKNKFMCTPQGKYFEK